MSRQVTSFIVAASILLLAATSRADTITLRGTTIAVPATVDRIETGRVFYVDHTGRSLYRSLDDVEHISFAALPQLNEAAQAMDNDRYRDALPHLMQALLAAQTDAQQIWIHAQLARAHDILGEYVQACGHFAAVVLLEDHTYWRRIAPVSEPNEPEFPAVEEAMVLLRKARQEVTQPHLVPIVSQMMQRVESIHRRLAAEYRGPPIEPGSTVSGIAREVILSAKPQAAEEPAPIEEQQEEPAAPPPQPTRVSDESIERLIEAEQWEEAIAACERAARESARRDVAQLLHQYGRALVGAGHPRGAAIMFTRCAILHRGTPHAALSLIETAIIYRDTFHRHDTAARLLDRASEEEHSHNREHVRNRIMEVRETLQLHKANNR